KKTAVPRMIQPSGLPGFRQATTKPTTANGADTQTGSEPPLAFRLWCARPASGTSAIIKASVTPPRTSAAAGDTSRTVQALIATPHCQSACGAPAWGPTHRSPVGKDRFPVPSTPRPHPAPTAIPCITTCSVARPAAVGKEAIQHEIARASIPAARHIPAWSAPPCWHRLMTLHWRNGLVLTPSQELSARTPLLLHGHGHTRYVRPQS